MKKVFVGHYSAIPVSRDEFLSFGFKEEDIIKGEVMGKLKTYGPWQIPIGYKALAMSTIYDDTKGYTSIFSETVYGFRSMTSCRQEGYELEGRVSVNGKKYRAFTSSQLFDVEGKLVDVAIIQVCNNVD